ncbi:MAG: hypothetical protein EKK53_12780 [Burkholderiales bacterium]|nr:MAG: hypothetical protein EKK53_12780 [Burkholderiales bacterium]
MKLGELRLDLRLRQAVEAGELALWDLRPELETVQYSPQWKTQLGFPDPHSADSTHFWRCRVHPEDLAPMIDLMREHMQGERPTYEATFRLRSNGSGYRRVHSRGRVIERGPQGRVLRMVGTMIDMTERPCTPAGGLPDGPRGMMAGTPIALPFHRLLGDALVAAERDRVLLLVEDLLQDALADVAAWRQQRPVPQPGEAGTASR